MTKRVTIMLNISLGLWVAYYALFFMGYFAQKPLLWWFFGGDYVMSDDFKPVFSPVLIGFSLIIMAGMPVFNLLLRKNSSPGLCIGAEVCAFIAFLSDRLIKGIVPAVKTILMGKLGNADAVLIGGLHAQSVGFLDMVLIAFYAVSLTLMVCACCIRQCERKSVTQ